MAARFDNSIVFMVGFLDFAYFLQHREAFRRKEHNRYMSSFIGPNVSIKSHDYKILKDGSIVAFDDKLLSVDDKFIFDNYKKIKFELVKK